MAESAKRGTLLRALKPLHPIFIENVMRTGTPDINYVEGWIELKWLDAWPKRATTAVAVKDFTPQQRIFLMNRNRAGGNARFMLCVGKEWLLLPGIWAALQVGKGARREEICRAAEKHWQHRLDSAELVEHLRPQKNNTLR